MKHENLGNLNIGSLINLSLRILKLSSCSFFYSNLTPFLNNEQREAVTFAKFLMKFL